MRRSGQRKRMVGFGLCKGILYALFPRQGGGQARRRGGESPRARPAPIDWMQDMGCDKLFWKGNLVDNRHLCKQTDLPAT